MMKEAEDFRLQSTSEADAQQLAAITALGMCYALEQRCVSPQYACDALFRPSLVQRLRELGADPALCQALEDALFIEDVFEQAPDKLMAYVDAIKNAVISYLKTHNWPNQQVGTNWTAPYP